MASADPKTIYKACAATAETVHADAKAHRGLNGLAVRGGDGALGSACLFALTYNILRLITLTEPSGAPIPPGLVVASPLR